MDTARQSAAGSSSAVPSLGTVQGCELALKASDKRLEELTAQLDELERYSRGRLTSSALGEDPSPEPRAKLPPSPTLHVNRNSALVGAPSAAAVSSSRLEAFLDELNEDASRVASPRSQYESMLVEEKETTRRASSDTRRS